MDGYTCECPTSCNSWFKDPKFGITNKGKESFEQFANEKVCAQVYDPVLMGIYYQNYESECHMRIAACNQSLDMGVNNMGECGKLSLKTLQHHAS